jgi:hypothetical protein
VDWVIWLPIRQHDTSSAPICSIPQAQLIRDRLEERLQRGNCKSLSQCYERGGRRPEKECMSVAERRGSKGPPF